MQLGQVMTLLICTLDRYSDVLFFWVAYQGKQLIAHCVGIQDQSSLLSICFISLIVLLSSFAASRCLLADHDSSRVNGSSLFKDVQYHQH